MGSSCFNLSFIGLLHEIVHQFHDEVVVVAVLSVFEAETVMGVEKYIVLKCLNIIDFLYLTL